MRRLFLVFPISRVRLWCKRKERSFFNKIDCVRIPVTNLEEGIAFYSKKLKHELLWKTDIAAGLKLSQDKSEIVLYTEPDGLEIDFQVNNVEQAVEEFIHAGGRIIKGPFDIPIGKCVVVKDPWGNEYVILDASKGFLETDESKQVIGLKK
ncbi:MAG: VOC family protein [Candidatus Thorarchaeota archaeon]